VAGGIYEQEDAMAACAARLFIAFTRELTAADFPPEAEAMPDTDPNTDADGLALPF
jgi:hypothetical protein